jgi:MoaE-MoaD fusion protein
MMQVQILLFATLKDVAGSKQITLTLDGDHATVKQVHAALIARFPALERHLPTAITAVNQEFAFPDDTIRENDEIALFPPVSGGAPHYAEIARLDDAPFSTDALIAAITTADTGAVCVFSGMVRGETHAPQGLTHHTVQLEYEAYSSMAIAKMQQVIAEIRAQFPLVQGIAIVQRVGMLRVGENTIAIACASGHRDQGCFEAARYGIDRLKAIVPVWKKETHADGTSWLEGEYLPTPNDRDPSGSE